MILNGVTLACKGVTLTGKVEHCLRYSGGLALGFVRRAVERFSQSLEKSRHSSVKSRRFGFVTRRVDPEKSRGIKVYN